MALGCARPGRTAPPKFFAMFVLVFWEKAHACFMFHVHSIRRALLCRAGCAARRSLTAELVTYNADAAVFGYWRVDLVWQDSGDIQGKLHLQVGRGFGGWDVALGV